MLPTLPHLDARSLPPPRRHAEILRRFDGLAPGEGFVLVDDHDPKALLHRLQAERAGLFDWNVLEKGPEAFRIEIRRRHAQGPRTVTELLGTDHQRLDAILGEVERVVAGGALPAAARAFAEFACGLDRHIDAEEKILFPSFEQATGISGGPTSVMREEHAEIRRFVEGVSTAFRQGDGPSARRALDGLRALLIAHNRKEEQILYPMADEAAGDPPEQDALARRIQTI